MVLFFFLVKVSKPLTLMSVSSPSEKGVFAIFHFIYFSKPKCYFSLEKFTAHLLTRFEGDVKRSTARKKIHTFVTYSLDFPSKLWKVKLSPGKKKRHLGDKLKKIERLEIMCMFTLSWTKRVSPLTMNLVENHKLNQTVAERSSGWVLISTWPLANTYTNEYFPLYNHMVMVMVKLCKIIVCSRIWIMVKSLCQDVFTITIT